MASTRELKKVAKVREPVFNQLVENVRYLMHEERQLNPAIRIHASVVFLKQNLQRIEHAAEFCEEHSIPELDLQNYLPYGLDDPVIVFLTTTRNTLRPLIRSCRSLRGGSR